MPEGANCLLLRTSNSSAIVLLLILQIAVCLSSRRVFYFFSPVFILFLYLSFRLSLFQFIWVAGVCVLGLSYPVRWHGIAGAALPHAVSIES